MPSPQRCTYLGCEVPATTLISPPYGRDWRGCATHAPAMIKALAIGQSQSAEVLTKPINARHLRVVA